MSFFFPGLYQYFNQACFDRIVFGRLPTELWVQVPCNVYDQGFRASLKLPRSGPKSRWQILRFCTHSRVYCVAWQKTTENIVAAYMFAWCSRPSSPGAHPMPQAVDLWLHGVRTLIFSISVPNVAGGIRSNNTLFIESDLRFWYTRLPSPMPSYHNPSSPSHWPRLLGRTSKTPDFPQNGFGANVSNFRRKPIFQSSSTSRAFHLHQCQFFAVCTMDGVRQVVGDASRWWDSVRYQAVATSDSDSAGKSQGNGLRRLLLMPAKRLVLLALIASLALLAAFQVGICLRGLSVQCANIEPRFLRVALA